ncbi:glycosyltransferase [Bradyrhizobium sp. SYSU BS000235]|uniref:glycosyltransferase n=1 Tax=Bradyrhizobium sp. SYSU BS000235 TaxID=3411332 RepID=UPI003C71AD35
MSAEFSGVPIAFHRKPLENWSWLPRIIPVKTLSNSIAHISETYIQKRRIKALVAAAVEFGRKHKVDRVWAVLQGQTNIRLALAVADELKVPLHSHVWDVFNWWIKANGIDPLTAQSTQLLFNDAIQKSASVAAASRPMADEYHQRFGVKAIPILSSLPKAMARSPDIAIGNTLTIGMAGQFYAANEWHELVKRLDAALWTVAGRPVRIIAMGSKPPPSGVSGKVTFLGWKSQNDAIDILSGCDFLYCPYPFDPSMEDVSRYSFPSKLVLYLAAGRPVIFHGPEFSPPAKYIAQKECGVVVADLAAQGILSEIERLSQDSAIYQRMATAAQRSFVNDFTLEAMAHDFRDFIGAAREDAVDPQDHTLGDGDVPQIDHLVWTRRGLASLIFRWLKSRRPAL